MTLLYVCYKSEQKEKKNQLDLVTNWIWWGRGGDRDN